MKFGDKLVVLRKKNGLSQEELAEKLNVSRQSVSKWESNNTYPETDKIIQICNLFDCNMDDLINDKVTDVEGSLRKNKNKVNIVFDSFLDFITRSINMFSNMSFKSGFKCVLELVVLSFILYIVGGIFCNVAGNIFSTVFKLFGYDVVLRIKSFLTAIFSIIWFILSIIILVHTFKIRYLNSYENDDTSNLNDDFKNEASFQEKNIENKKIVSSEKDKPFVFLRVFSKIIIWIFKFLVFELLLGIGGFLVFLLVCFVLFVSAIFIHKIFLGLSLAILSGIIVAATLVFIGLSFIFNLKFFPKTYVILLIISLFTLGIGIGLSITSIKGLKIIETNDDIYKLEEKSFETKYEDNLFIEMKRSYDSYIYRVDDNMIDGDISLSTTYDSRLRNLFISSNYHKVDGMNGLYLHDNYNRNIMDIYHMIVEDLSLNQVHASYDYINKDPLIIKANSNTINKLIDNLKKVYLVSEENNNGDILINIVDTKVYYTDAVVGSYNAVTDELVLNNNDEYECVRSIKETEYGDQIIYSCHWIKD